MSDGPRRVALIATGGTISSLYGDHGAVASLAGAEIVDAAGIEHSRVGPVIDVARVNGSDVTLDVMHQVATACQRVSLESDVAGVVVTHGTDSLEETAYWCDLTVETNKPVVVTGAMRPPSSPESDGHENLRRAFGLAAHTDAAGLGCLVCVGEQVHAARWARKTHTVDLPAFESPHAAPLGVIGSHAITFDRRVVPWRVPLRVPDDWPSVPVVTAYTGMPNELVREVAEATRARGLVIEGFGMGNVPSSIAPAVEKLLSDGVQVAIATRVLEGGIQPVYGGPGGHGRLRDVGVLSSPWLSAAKTRLLLTLCLAANPSDVRPLFNQGVEASTPFRRRTT